MNEINNLIYNKIGTDCGDIILDYKKDLDEYEKCLNNYNELLRILFHREPSEIIWGEMRVLRVYEKITLSNFIYFLKYYTKEDELLILNFYKIKINTRDNYGNFNKDYWLCHKKYNLEKFFELSYYNWFVISTIKCENGLITFNLNDNYIRKKKRYEKIYSWLKKKFCKKQTHRLHNRSVIWISRE
jgi:hypothetical protein